MLNSDKRHGSSTTQDATVPGSETVHDPCQQWYPDKKRL